MGSHDHVAGQLQIAMGFRDGILGTDIQCNRNNSSELAVNVRCMRVMYTRGSTDRGQTPLSRGERPETVLSRASSPGHHEVVVTGVILNIEPVFYNDT